MSTYSESPELFDCCGCRLIGILHSAPPDRRVGVVMLVGGPQYRVGAHRMFVAIARGLARNAIPTLRFDYRGMGDSDGDFPGFENLDDDISAAVRHMRNLCPDLCEVVLIGLCDGATAAALYRSECDAVTRMVFLNPWAHTDAGQAKAYLSYYYRRRIWQKSFWVSLAKGQVGVLSGLRDLAHQCTSVILNRVFGDNASHEDYRSRMRENLARFAGSVMVVLSEHDMTAVEFRDFVENDKAWKKILQQPNFAMIEIPGADHTLSDPAHIDRFVELVSDWIIDDRVGLQQTPTEPVAAFHSQDHSAASRNRNPRV